MAVPRIRTIAFGGLYWGLSILGNYHIKIAPAELCSHASY